MKTGAKTTGVAKSRPQGGQCAAERRTLLFCAVVAFAVLLICTKSSFLYPLNDWVDANCFFTVGKSMFSGRVLYRDIVEQKGPYLYLLHGVAWLFARDSFLGVFFFEWLAGAVFLFYACRFLELFCSRTLSLLALPAVALLVWASPAFCHGDSAEELSLPFVMASLYWLVQYWQQGGPDRALYVRSALSGVFAGILFLAKFTLTGAYIAWCLLLPFAIRARGRKAGVLGRSWGLFAAGGLAALLPWAVYFTVNHAVRDAFDCYFVYNIFHYAQLSPGGAGQGVLVVMLRAFGVFAKANPLQAGLGAAGLALFAVLAGSRRALAVRLGVLAAAAVSAFFIFIGGISYGYYGLALAVYLVPALAGLLAGAEKLARRPLRLPAGASVLLCAGLTAAAVALALRFSGNVYLLKVKKEEMPQYQFAAILRQTDHPTLLNYGFLDGGFYTAADIVPNCRHFCRLNAEIPGAESETRALLRDKAFDYVVTRDDPGDETLLGSYTLVATSEFWFEGGVRVYRLFAARP